MAQASPYTVFKLIKRSLRLLRVLEVGENPTNEEQQDGLEALNAMVDSWALLRLLIYTTLRVVVPVKAGQATYQIGPNAPDWPMQRPVYIDGAGMLFAGQPDQLERPMKVYTPREWRDNRIKGYVSDVSLGLMYDAGFSNANTSGADVGSGNVTIWPVPSADGSLALYLPQAVSQFTSILQPLALPPGYQRALTYNHAIEYSEEFEATPSAAVIAIAAESLELLMRANVQVNELRMPAGLARGRGFDIRIGE